MVVSPEFTGSTDTGLDFIDDEEYVVAGGDVAKALKEGGEAWLSPPSDWTGSTTTAATGLGNSLIRRSVSSRQRFSSAAFSEANSLRGYLSAGKGAWGQSKAGMSSLWMGLDRVVDRLPKRRPWKPFLKDMMDISGAPGAWLFMEESISA